MKLDCTRGATFEYLNLETKKKYVSVSQVLKVLDPDAFAGVDPYIMAAASQRGEDLHVLFGLMLLSLNGLAQWPERPPGLIGQHFDSIARFVEKRKPRPIRVEERAANDEIGHAGQPDTECWLDDIDSIIDLKTGIPRPVHSVQLHAYKRLDGYGKAKRLYSLYSQKNGSEAKLKEHTTDHVDWGGFLAGIAVLNWRRLRNT